MRYHVPRDGFVWHSDSGPRKRVPNAAWVMLFAGVCFAAGIWSARVWTPSVSNASSAVVGEPSVALSKAKPLQPRVWTEPTVGPRAALGGSLDVPQAPPAPAVATPHVKIINPDADEASIDPSMATPQAEPMRPKAVRPRPTRAEPAPRPPIAPQAGPQGSSGYSALRQQLLDRAP